MAKKSGGFVHGAPKGGMTKSKGKGGKALLASPSNAKMLGKCK